MAPHAPFSPLTKQDIAQVLNVTTRTIENWTAAGIVPAPTTLGGRVFWHPDTFYAWLDLRLREGASTSTLGCSEQNIPQKPKKSASQGSIEQELLRRQNSKRLAVIEEEHI